MRRRLIHATEGGPRLYRDDDDKWWALVPEHGEKFLPVHSVTVTIDERGTSIDRLHVDTTGLTTRWVPSA